MILFKWGGTVFSSSSSREARKLQLPKGMKKKIHGIIREQVRSKAGLLATFGLGFAIAGCTVICTAQVYLPTIGYIMTIPN